MRLKTPFVVENRAGANGSIAAGAVSRSDPDGYTLLVAGAATMTTDPFLRPKTNSFTLSSLTPVTNLLGINFVLLKRSSLNVNSFDELVRMIKANPRQLNMATTTPGSYPYLAAELLKQMGGLDFVTVVYNGGVAAAAAVAAGEADFLIETEFLTESLVQAGKLTVLASLSATREVSLPHVPTVAESGFPGFELTGWAGMMAPRGVPPHLIDIIQSNAAAFINEPDTLAKLARMGISSLATGPVEFESRLTRERETWRKLITASGLTLN